MLLRDFLPGPAVREFVQCYRIIHFEFDKLTQIPFKVYSPKPEECLYFILHDSVMFELSNSVKKNSQLPIIIGQQTIVNTRYFHKKFLNLQVVFQPTGLFRLTGMPAFDLTNQVVDAEYIFSKDILFIHEQLQHSKSYKEMLLIADKFVAELINHARKDVLQLDSVSKLMMQRPGNISLDWLAKESCLCTKQFKRIFYERTGVNPKIYARIIRLNRAFNFKNQFPDKDWSSVAIKCGYFDYQHLAKDYKDFTGLTPPKLHLLEKASPESVLGLTKSLYHTRFRATC